ncbi:unnamed protein product [Diatraea saccharalis]|uniref:HAT C-terminal dimerisation domain-containing protein n=1 Tax=Diatraea saccharalis TaxID=40085 RepID=A0A9N9RAU0_9NEOP|nr:unnamed protein product [Diatraea saccharalis]
MLISLITNNTNRESPHSTEAPRQNQNEIFSGVWSACDSLIKEAEDDEPLSNMSIQPEQEEVESYLRFPNIPIKQDPKIYWRQEDKYPKLKKLAQKYLSYPMSSVASERLFSTAGLIQNDLRNRLSADNLNKLCFLNKNLPKRGEKNVIRRGHRYRGQLLPKSDDIRITRLEHEDGIAPEVDLWENTQAILEISEDTEREKKTVGKGIGKEKKKVGMKVTEKMMERKWKNSTLFTMIKQIWHTKYTVPTAVKVVPRLEREAMKAKKQIIYNTVNALKEIMKSFVLYLKRSKKNIAYTSFESFEEWSSKIELSTIYSRVQKLENSIDFIEFCFPIFIEEYQAWAEKMEQEVQMESDLELQIAQVRKSSSLPRTITTSTSSTTAHIQEALADAVSSDASQTFESMDEAPVQKKKKVSFRVPKDTHKRSSKTTKKRSLESATSEEEEDMTLEEEEPKKKMKMTFG